jgi:hypothetical protein
MIYLYRKLAIYSFQIDNKLILESNTDQMIYN